MTACGLQYEYVKDSRKALLEYCSTISRQDFLRENSSFGRGSIRNLLVHIANTYEFWIGKHGLKAQIDFTEYHSVSGIEDIGRMFNRTDRLVDSFLTKLEKSEIQTIEFDINNIRQRAEPLKLFTHVITHEFHHKGQILSLSRHLGYTPVDTDILR